MYVIDHHVKPERRTGRKLLVTFTIVAVLCSCAGAWIYYDTKKSQQINQPNQTPIVSSVKAAADNRQTIDEPLYTFKVPPDWKLKERVTGGRYPYVEWIGPPGDGILRIYSEELPLDMAFNKLLPVSVSNNRIVPGPLSDNCITFTGAQTPDGKPENPALQKLPSKWQNVNFLCDVSNYLRNIVGVASSEHGYGLALTGEKTGTHRFMFHYLNHSARPSYTNFIEALRSFQVK